MKKPRRYLSLEKTILILICLVVFLSLLVTNILVSEEVATATEKNIASRAVNISRIVAHSPIVIDGLSGRRDKREIQTYAGELMDLTKVNYIVVMDMKGIRVSHPNVNELGKPFMGGDEGTVLQGKEHISTAKGTLGLSMRAFSPVFDEEGEQVGAVAVGILMNTVEEAVRESRSRTYFGMGLGFIVGILGAIFLAKRIKKIMFGLEPFAIARILQERSAMLESVREGIVAIDAEGKVTLTNAEAARLMSLAGIGDVKAMDSEMIPDSVFKRVLDKGEPVLDLEYDVRGVTLLTNTVPLKVDGEIVGAVSTFRDKTEIKQLGEELSGVKVYAEALRAQTHEFMNKIHVILGLVHMKKYEQLGPYVSQIAHQYQTKGGPIVRNIRDPILAGFIQAKMSNARENGCELLLNEESYCPQAKDSSMVHDLVTIIGNLLTNSFEAVKEKDTNEVELSLVYGEGELLIRVADQGSGIPAQVMKNMFVKGYSTKSNGRGFGLFLVQKSVEQRKGRMQIDSGDNKGTTFEIFLPYDPLEETL
ncbi:putative sensor protein DcuS [Desulfitobacterium hafniense DP7]|uniref:histidine kinase n=1 Tax=Desulfitobacterium hafniense DP7 TaxID=537010 RepID=G9XV16_DESHA|nr:sensor histidine kinase [Desulfitobacterium hafniense]EHL04502.1 putative sensor protein DcuS [Desulfitobacterium hafniense DP7]